MNLTKRVPYWYLDHCKIGVKNGNVFASSESGSLNIPVDVGLLLLGPGVSITTNALTLSSKLKINVAVSSSNNTPSCILSVVGKIGSQDYAKNQASFVSDPSRSIIIAKNLIKQRFPLIHLNNPLKIEQLRGIEGSEVKKLYKSVFGPNFIRNYKSTDDSNVFLNIANNTLYNLTKLACIQYGLSPHLGFIHKKRNSFVYDISDVFKITEYFSEIRDSNSIKSCLSRLNEYFIKIKFFKKIEGLFSVFSDQRQ